MGAAWLQEQLEIIQNCLKYFIKTLGFPLVGESKAISGAVSLKNRPVLFTSRVTVSGDSTAGFRTCDVSIKHKLGSTL